MLINNCLLIGLFLFSSCSNTNFDPTRSRVELEQSKPHRRWVYCTQADRLNDKKTIDYDNENLCLRKYINVGQYRLSLKRTILNHDADGDDNIGYNELIISKKNKIVKIIKLETKDDPFFFVTGFAKIRKGLFIKDLNYDGTKEFALVHYGMSQNRYTKAKIFSLSESGNLTKYGAGRFNKNGGGHVLFGCPDCHTINMNACKSCY